MHSVKRKIQYGNAIGEKVYYPTKENVNENLEKKLRF